ncbi:MAG: bifunctional DNA primase/polymerase [Myxococcales bacterium]|nr:bifunctional DNA primase/polymerase [Myxococcales bacterium]
MSDDILNAALAYAGRGWAVIPVGTDKKPAISNWQHDGSTDPKALQAWFGAGHPGRNLGIVCGLSGLVVVDVDPRNGGSKTFARLEADLGRLPPTATADTGGGGVHYLFQAPDADLVSKLGSGVDLLHGGRQFLVAPSIHRSGIPYRWRDGLSPDQVSPAPLPTAWIELARRQAAAPAATPRPSSRPPDELIARRASAYLAELPAAVSGQDGHTTTFTAAVSLVRGFDLSQDDAFALLAAEYNPRCDPPWTEKELRHKVANAADASRMSRGYLLEVEPPTGGSPRSRRGAPPYLDVARAREVDTLAGHDPEPAGKTVVPVRYRLSELGNAQRLAATHCDRLRYVKAWGWLTWDGRRWQRDQVGASMVAGKSVVGDIFSEASTYAARAALGDEEAGMTAKMLTSWAHTSSRWSAIKAMTGLAESERPIAATADQFDRDQFAFNVDNGTVALRTGTLRPHGRDDMITRLAPVAYIPDAPAPMWNAFLERVLPDAAVREWIQRYFGYCLTGDVSEQVLMFGYGSGANGKSVLLDVMLAILGDYGLRAAPDLVLAKHGEVHPTELADLEGRRLVVCSEIEQGRRWAESTIKRITGDTTITARRMRMDFYSFSATHKVVIAANTKPAVTGADHAIWRRMRLVPFEVTIPALERDKTLVNKLITTEAPGILAWAVRGCLAWQRDGLGEAPAITDATEDYRADQDVLGQWIGDRCVLGNVFTSTAELYASYLAWCRDAGVEPWPRETMRTLLVARRGLTERRVTSARGVQGIGLRPPALDRGLNR